MRGFKRGMPALATVLLLRAACAFSPRKSELLAARNIEGVRIPPPLSGGVVLDKEYPVRRRPQNSTLLLSASPLTASPTDRAEETTPHDVLR